MNEQIENYAKRLKLSWIRENYKDIKADTHEEYLLKLFEKEVENREERKINLLLSQAQLPKTGTQPFQWEHIQIPQGIDRSTVLNGSFIKEKENLILYGGVGTGKTYLATLISLNAIHRFGSRVKFFTVAALVNKLIEENQKGSLPKFMKQIEKLDLLVLDELGYIPLNKEGAELLFQVISMCYENRSIVITTNLQFGQWNHVFGDPILTEAVIDRLIHHSHLLVFTGDSFRYKESLLHQ
ncbi:IS21-like element helper ATPase IstB [Salipaludibacillus sp. LMS25]|uniref:IS21-like element helper ATPase IstB n=1 Tax=Salipaludibacillus sp. LMS25 TaxID=2924031 RepID=UPI0020D1C93E|nr:IS21-like element helper ATPase IstB [Salipaludibacillus sp. LMS25]UTR13122.1 IS21-like element helper ATPase IstB [Salipaludibacillus sp. LMS25]UTR13726.1 IS21-like element helper ATPase IstB [Salipaludibacillus sp. LMS25]UTR14131.1 IS21-like element helper ATPase IstB [Salipaludibacillus sp. LMS25]UTR14783.1 IS21-like element helper ATPase IstB [Salipaludibacillus sp. LMS25]UTR14910.1 IS21-like element helper ATPase IstB [Salipaludibacillus sp. LMS25]